MAPPIKICRFGFGGGETLRGVFALRSPVAAGAGDVKRIKALWQNPFARPVARLRISLGLCSYSFVEPSHRRAGSVERVRVSPYTASSLARVKMLVWCFARLCDRSTLVNGERREHCHWLEKRLTVASARRFSSRPTTTWAALRVRERSSQGRGESTGPEGQLRGGMSSTV
jgi:hypothetical protein